MVRPLPPYTTRWIDLKIEYDMDYAGNKQIVRQRYYTPTPENDYIDTPVTNLLLARRLEPNRKVPRASLFDPRHVDACFENENNLLGYTTRSVIIPYLPATDSFKDQVKEIYNYTSVATDINGREVTTQVQELSYVGETFDREKFLKYA